jgi:hypothetical protein
VEWPSTGRTIARPTNKGNEPISREPATMRPHIAIVIGFAITALTDAVTAVVTPTSRSRSSGKDTTLRVNTTTAKRKPTPQPTMMSAQPDGVVKTWRANSAIDAGTAPPKKSS